MDRDLIIKIAGPLLAAALTATGVGTYSGEQVARSNERSETCEMAIEQLVHTLTRCEEWRE